MMKFQMSAEEFATFGKTCAAAAIASLTVEYQLELADLNAALQDMHVERNEALDRADTLRRDSEDYEENIAYLRGECRRKDADLDYQREQIRVLQDQVRQLEVKVPDRKERMLSEAFELFQNGNKIGAIKKIRETLNLGLKDAKDLVEGVCTDGRQPEFFALSQIFKGRFTDTIEHLTNLLKPYVKPGASEGDLMLIVTGKFHQLETAVAAE